MPVVSSLRETVTEITPSGQETVKETWEGVYSRTFDGSALRTLTRVYPKETQPESKGILIDRDSQKVYELVFHIKTAVLRQDTLPDSKEEPSAARARALAAYRNEKTFQGIPCFIMPVETTEFGGVRFSGHGCYSTEYDLHLYQQIDRTVIESGVTNRTITEMYKLEIGRDPGSDSIRIPNGFVVQEGLCTDCTHEH